MHVSEARKHQVMKAVKYTFDNHFSSTGNPAPVRRVEPKYDAKAMDRAREDSYASGVAAGYEQAMAETARKLCESVEQIGSQLQVLQDQARARRQTAKQDTARLAQVIGMKLAASLVKQIPLAELEDLVADCLATCHQEPKLIIKLNKMLVEPMQAQIDELRQRQHFEGEIILKGDAGIPLGDGSVEWHDGGAERNSSELNLAIEGIVERYVHSLAADGLQAH